MEQLSYFKFPVSALLGITFILVNYLIYRHFSKSRVVSYLSGLRCASVLISVVAAVIAVEGVWGIKLHLTWPFWILCLLMCISLIFCIMRRIEGSSTKQTFPQFSISRLSFIFTHLGFLLIILGGFFGAADITKANIIAMRNTSSDIAFDSEHLKVQLPFSIRLEDFTIDYYDDNRSPKQFTSTITITDSKRKDATQRSLKTSVNNPCSYNGYRIYQEGYDTINGNYSILKIVRDPYIPIVYLGMLLLFIGAAASLVGRWSTRTLITAIAILAIAFGFASVRRINFEMLPPALRNWLFAPHLILYMAAYSAMSIALIFSLLSTFKPKAESESEGKYAVLTDKLVRTSSVLLLMGMLCGCIWAQQAWGSYWEWDPKECWAAVTWLLSLLYMHIKPLKKKSSTTALIIIAITFIALQITWYGVNYLPSASASMHTYN